MNWSSMAVGVHFESIRFDMQRIISAKANLLEIRLDRPVGGSGVTHVDVVVVDMDDDEERSGLGFTYALGGNGNVVLECVRYQLDKVACGQELVHPNALWETIATTFNRTGWGPNLVGLATFDVAAWDLYSKRLKVPLASALGGVFRPIPLYGSGGFTATQSAAEAAHVAEAPNEDCRRSSLACREMFRAIRRS
jgi:L-alanine-DL-glutamate epimerase-like enolase superfamily enzyme